MPRPPKPITTDNYQLLWKQLERLLADSEKAKDAINGDYDLAKSAFMNMEDTPTALANWISEWLTSESRTRMWATLRQKNFKKKHKVHVLVVSEKAYTALRDTAKHHHLPLSDTIIMLVNQQKKI